MTNDTNDTTTTTAKPKSKRAPSHVDHSAAIAMYARAKGIDTTRAGKLFRARLRANFDVIAKNDPANYGAKGKVKNRANDQKPWGAHKRTTLKELGLIK